MTFFVLFCLFEIRRALNALIFGERSLALASESRYCAPPARHPAATDHPNARLSALRGVLRAVRVRVARSKLAWFTEEESRAVADEEEDRATLHQ